MLSSAAPCSLLLCRVEQAGCGCVDPLLGWPHGERFHPGIQTGPRGHRGPPAQAQATERKLRAAAGRPLAGTTPCVVVVVVVYCSSTFLETGTLPQKWSTTDAEAISAGPTGRRNDAQSATLSCTPSCRSTRRVARQLPWWPLSSPCSRCSRRRTCSRHRTCRRPCTRGRSSWNGSCGAGGSVSCAEGRPRSEAGPARRPHSRAVTMIMSMAALMRAPGSGANAQRA